MKRARILLEAIVACREFSSVDEMKRRLRRALQDKHGQASKSYPGTQSNVPAGIDEHADDAGELAGKHTNDAHEHTNKGSAPIDQELENTRVRTLVERGF